MTRRLLVLVALLLVFAQSIWFCVGSPSFASRQFSTPEQTMGAGADPRSVFWADLDNDTGLDLAVAYEYSDNVSILKSNGDGSYQSTVKYGAGDDPNSVFCADLDGDTDLDLALADYLGSNVPVLFSCRAAGDCDQDDVVDIGDAVYPIWLMI